MAAIIVVGILYILFRDQSVLQKHNSTPAAEALLPDAETDSFQSLTGEPISIAENFGSIIIVSTWASWCPQCAADFSELGEIATEFKDKKVVVYAVNRGEDTYTAERFLSTLEKPEAVTFLIDQSDFFFENSAGYAMPETIVYNKSGEVLIHQRGELRKDELVEAVRALTD